MTLALNVLAAAGMGYSWKYIPVGQETQDGDEFSARYRDNLALLLTSVRLLGTTPKWMYELGPNRVKYLPKLFRDHVLAAQAFRKQMRQLVEERKVEVAAGKANENIFLNAMIAKSVEMRQEKLAKSSSADGEFGELEAGGAGGLNDDEIFANMFDYNIAGHETTAHSLNYCFHILSVEPEWQDWIREEVDHVYGTTALDSSTLEYEQYFYRLKRCLALMVRSLYYFRRCNSCLVGKVIILRDTLPLIR
jgi:cytochrome P450